MSSPSPDVAGLIAQLRSLHRAVSDALDGAAPDQAFAGSTSLAEALLEMGRETAEQRAAIAARIAEAENLSLAGLADRISVSRSRAAQLLRSARKTTAARSTGAP